MATEGDRELEDLFASYVDRLNAGEELDAQRILAENPIHGAEILDHIADYVAVAGGADAVPAASVALGTLGDYTLRRQIGRGGMGLVYEAWENSMDRPVALKVLPAAVAADTRTVTRFVREAQIAGKLSHPNVVSVYAVGVKGAVPYYAMELVEGETLAQIVARMRTRVEGEAPAEPFFGAKRDEQEFYLRLVRAFADVADGLQHAHSRGVVHRDIKPSNLILETFAAPRPGMEDGAAGSGTGTGSSGEGTHAARLRILDFGLARLEGQESLSASGDVVGTPLYMSPEQARRRKVPVDHRTDVYSLGATLYEVLTLEPPFRGKDHEDTLSQIIARDPRPPRQLNPRVPRDLETIVLKCLRKEPGDRYGTAEALGQDLRRFVRGDPIEARAEAGWTRMGRRLRRHRTTGLMATAILILGTLAAWLSHERRIAEHERSLAQYEPAVLEVLRRIYAGYFSLGPTSARSGEFLGFPAPRKALSPLSARDVQPFREPRYLPTVLEAVQDLSAIAAALPERPDAHYHLALAYRTLERQEEARVQIDWTIRCDPSFVPARVLQIELSMKGSLLESEEFARILAQYRDEPGWRRSWLLAYRSMKAKSWPEGIAALGEILDLRNLGRPEPYIGCFFDAYLRRGVAHMESKEYSAAQADFAVAEYLLPGPEPMLLLGKTCCLAGDGERAASLFAKLREDSEGETKDEVSLWITAVYSAVAEYQEGLDWVDHLFPEVPIKERLRAFFLYRLGRTPEAIEAARRAIAANGQDQVAHLLLATALLQQLWAAPSGDRAVRLREILRIAKRAADLDGGDESAKYVFDLVEKETKQCIGGGAMRSLSIPMGGALMALVTNADALPQDGAFLNVRKLDDPVNSSAALDGGATVTGDGLIMVFHSQRAEGVSDLYMATREQVDDEFGNESFRALAELNTAVTDSNPFISTDGLVLYFASNRRGTSDIFTARRSARDQPFQDPEPVVSLNSAAQEKEVSLTEDGLHAVLFRDDGLYVATRESGEAEFRDLTPCAELNRYQTFCPSLSSDGLAMFFMDYNNNPPGGYGMSDLWLARRDRNTDAFGLPVPFTNPIRLRPPVNSAAWDCQPEISRDWPAAGSKLYFNRGVFMEDHEIFEATWYPGVPFRRADANDDGSVDIADAVFTLIDLFVDSSSPTCLDAADANDDGAVDIADPVSTLNYLFRGGTPPAEPFGSCGIDATVEELSCESFQSCQ